MLCNCIFSSCLIIKGFMEFAEALGFWGFSLYFRIRTGWFVRCIRGGFFSVRLRGVGRVLLNMRGL